MEELRDNSNPIAAAVDKQSSNRSSPDEMHKAEDSTDLEDRSHNETAATVPSTTVHSSIVPCHNYFSTSNNGSNMEDDPKSHRGTNASNNDVASNSSRDDDDYSSLDYPTDENTHETLNSLNSYHRRMLGMDLVGDTVTAGYAAGDGIVDYTGDIVHGGNVGDGNKAVSSGHRNASGVDDKNHHVTALNVLEIVAAGVDALNTATAATGDDDKYFKSNDLQMKNAVVPHQQQQQQLHPQEQHSLDASNSNSSMENQVKQPQERPNRLSILEMAKRRMFLSRRRVSTAVSMKTESVNRGTNVDGIVIHEGSKEALKTNGGNEDGNAVPKGSDVVTMTNCPSPTLKEKNVRILLPSEEEDSFLNNATIENIYPPSNQYYDTSSKESSVPLYNPAISTMSQSTLTTSTNHLKGMSAFVHMGGDVDEYVPSSPTPEYTMDLVETTASPGTVVASGSRPLMGHDSSSSGTTSSPSGESGETPSTSTSGSTECKEKSNSKARDMYDSIRAEATIPPMACHSRSSSRTSTEDRIWEESNLAVQHLHNHGRDSGQSKASLHHRGISAVEITPVQRTTNTINSYDPSLDSYSYNQAFKTMDNITTHPELSLPTLTNAEDENPFAPNLPEDYSFCPTKQSNFSTLTDEYVQYYDVTRRTGSVAVAEREENVTGTAITGALNAESTPKSPGPVDVDTQTILPNNDEESFRYDSSSIARSPPIDSTSMQSNWKQEYGNSKHLSRIIQYPSVDDGSAGDGEGYIDEEAAVRFASLHRSNRGHCSTLLIWGAVGLLAVSLAIVTFGVFLQKDEGRASSNGSLLGMPVETEDDDGSLSGNEAGLFPFVPELIDEQPTSSPVISILATPISSIASGLSTNPPSIGVSTMNPSPPSTITSESPSSNPTRKPSRHPSSPPTLLTMSPTRAPSKPIIQTFRPTFGKIDAQNETYTTTVKVSRDTYIRTTSSNWNYGTSEFLRVDQDPRSIAVLAFDINLNNELLQSSKRYYQASKEDQAHRREQTTQILVRVEEATLWLYSLEDSDSGGGVYALSDAKQWREEVLTWDNARSEVSASGETWISPIEGTIDEGNWFEVDVTEAFECCVKNVGPMHLNLLIQSDSSDGVTYASKEYESGYYAPELTLTYSMMVS